MILEKKDFDVLVGKRAIKSDGRMRLTDLSKEVLVRKGTIPKVFLNKFEVQDVLVAESVKPDIRVGLLFFRSLDLTIDFPNNLLFLSEIPPNQNNVEK